VELEIPILGKFRGKIELLNSSEVCSNRKIAISCPRQPFYSWRRWRF